eukprot:CAMPEP_0119268946 /NCGR_PEP_ID=MMETSP1329-20130426/6545_1 /TAXON_ID=114041 /ORGANISM="Genus nov. species nov., Strain RCC1024" /LENGTH=191 /DNA_ID=CAMNT_0007268931 /DNA_START=79 /DNA_END=651 /DNA_ORIENTATION=-
MRSRLAAQVLLLWACRSHALVRFAHRRQRCAPAAAGPKESWSLPFIKRKPNATAAVAAADAPQARNAPSAPKAPEWPFFDSSSSRKNASAAAAAEAAAAPKAPEWRLPDIAENASDAFVNFARAPLKDLVPADPLALAANASAAIAANASDAAAKTLAQYTNTWNASASAALAQLPADPLRGVSDAAAAYL